MDMSDLHISEAHLHIVSATVLGLHQEPYYINYIVSKITIHFLKHVVE